MDCFAQGDSLSESLATQVTRDIELDSDLTVTTENQITAEFDVYPVKIIDDPNAFTAVDRAKFARIANGLRVDYIFAVSPIPQGRNS